LQHHPLVRLDLDHLHREGAGEVVEIPGDLGTGLQPPDGTAVVK